MIGLHPLPAHMRPHHPATLIATYLLAGLIKPASGTWGSLAALPLGLYTAFLFGPFGLLLLAAIGYGLGHWASTVWLNGTDDQDPSAIVIDEAVGMWLAMTPLALLQEPFSPLGIALAFALFRLFDIVKPWPVSWADAKLGGATGIMLDDVLAGLWAALMLAAAAIYGLI